MLRKVYDEDLTARGRLGIFLDSVSYKASHISLFNMLCTRTHAHIKLDLSGKRTLTIFGFHAMLIARSLETYNIFRLTSR